jgi:plasmid replication initiation protein
MSAINNNQQTGRRFQFTGYEFFKFIGRKKFGGKAYGDLWASLERLHNTFVETNIRLGDSARNHSFNWLSEIKQTIENGRHRGYEIVIPEWLYNSVVNDKLVLTLDDGYFGIKGGLERWLYLFARKTSGWQTGGWSESVYSIYQKSGSRSSFSEFKRQINRILAKKSLLGYNVNLVDGKREDGLHFLRNNQLIELSSKGRKSKGATHLRKEIDNE